jgi:nitroimidazol reductase NimA-like FMN-containing flavoprotein (pyridoxamine 5'-phosphate oxidase superfamily)
MDTDDTPAPSDRVRLRRLATRGRYDRDAVHAVLDAGLVAHVGVESAEGPVVLPMAYGRTDDTLYLHGASANALLGAGVDAQLCATVTLVDGLVLARSPFHNSMNFRCVVVRGLGRRVTDPDEHREALVRISDHVVTTWEHGRPPSDLDLRRTLVLAVPLAEASVKVRQGDPVDEPEDLDGPHWAGTVAVRTTFGEPVPAADLAPGIGVPTGISRSVQARASATARGTAP